MRDDAAAGMHQEDGAGRALLRQPRAQPVEVALHHRLDVGVGAGGVEALVFPHLGGDVGGQRDREAREPLGQHVAHEALVGRAR